MRENSVIRNRISAHGLAPSLRLVQFLLVIGYLAAQFLKLQEALSKSALRVRFGELGTPLV